MPKSKEIKEKYTCCGGPTASGGHQPHCPLLRQNKMKKEIKEKLYKLREEYLKTQVDWANVEPKKSTIDFILRKFINWIEENGYEI